MGFVPRKESMSKPRAKSADEVQLEVLQHMHAMAVYWAGLPDKTPLERTTGVVFSILAMIDGVAATPALTLSVLTDPTDKAYHKQRGENWYENGMSINDNVMLHDLYATYK